jgi:tripartite-type tricarboxylate transporter receptor subunit TctC
MLAAAVAGHAFLAGEACSADGFPSATVKIVVPNPAGGTADALPRIIAEPLAKVWQKPVVIDNRTGAAGNIGAEYVFRAPADGHTLLSSPPTTLAINQSLYKQLTYDSTKFKPITVLGSSPNVLIVSPKLGVSTVKELIDKAKANPGAIAYGSQGIGSTGHLTGVLFESMAGVKLNHVPYRGTAPAMKDLLGGHIQVMFDNLSSSLPQHQAGALKIIAVCTPERSSYLADVPTMVEAGLPGFVSVTWFGMVAPPGTPDDIVARINRDVVAVLKTEEVRSKYLAQGATPVGNTPAEMAAFIAAERKRWADVIETAQVKLEE